jgi:hypothetical protein
VEEEKREFGGLHNERMNQYNKAIKLTREAAKLKKKSLTTGRAWVPLKGSTRQEEGTVLFLLREVNRRTSFSKSFTERSSEILAASPAPEYNQRGLARA